MKAIVINKDKSLSYTDVPNPVLKDGEVLIEVYASAINRADLLQREGNYPPPAGCPEWPGLEVSGVIVEVAPGVTKWKVGDKVCALLGGGGYAEYVSVPEGMVMPIPNGLSFIKASAIPEVYMTAYLNLFHIGNAKKGETLLFTGANSGLASAVIPMAKTFGLRVITTVRGQDKKEKVAYLGADRVVDTLTEDIAYNVEVTGAGIALEQALKFVAPMGRISLLGCTRISDMHIDYYQEVHRPGVKLIGAHNMVRPKVESFPGHWTMHDDCACILDLIKGGRCDAKSIISEIHPPKECGEVYARLAKDLKSFPLGVLFDWKQL